MSGLKNGLIYENGLFQGQKCQMGHEKYMLEIRQEYFWQYVDPT